MKIKTTIAVFITTLFLGFTACNTEEISSASNENTAIETPAETSSGNTTAKIGNCSEVPGWASQNGSTTGGGSSAETTVTTYAQLKSAIESSSVKVIKVSGTITVTTRLSFQDQTGKTIYGTSGAKLVSTNQTKDASGIINIKRCKNIIIRNLILKVQALMIPTAGTMLFWTNAPMFGSITVSLEMVLTETSTSKTNQIILRFRIQSSVI